MERINNSETQHTNTGQSDQAWSIQMIIVIIDMRRSRDITEIEVRLFSEVSKLKIMGNLSEKQEPSELLIK